MQKSVIGWIARAAMHVERTLPGASYLHRDDLIGYGAIGLCEARDRFREGGGAQFKTFAWRRVRGSIVDGVRSEYRHGAKVVGAVREHGTASTVADVPDALEKLLRRERARLVRDVLAGLNEEDRRFLVATIVEGQTIDEARAAIGLSRSGACRRLQRILDHCRREMEQLECR